MRILILTMILSIFYFTLTFGQDVIEFELGKSEQSNEKFSFYIESVEDIRENTTSIGKVAVGSTNEEYSVQLTDGVDVEVHDYFKSFIPKSEDASPLTLKIEEFKVDEIRTEEESKSTFALKAQIFENGELQSTERLLVYKKGEDCRDFHSSNIKLGLRKLVAQYAAGYHSSIRHRYENIEGKSGTYEGHGNLSETSRDRSVVAIGYQIGGWTLLGFNYEFRFNNALGIHIGGGLSGYTAGIKLHFDKRKNSDFLNLSYKDGGFGLIQTINIEFGGQIPSSKGSDFGLYAQIGVGFVLAIEPALTRAVFEKDKDPGVVFSFGLGFCF